MHHGNAGLELGYTYLWDKDNRHDNAVLPCDSENEAQPSTKETVASSSGSFYHHRRFIIAGVVIGSMLSVVGVATLLGLRHSRHLTYQHGLDARPQELQQAIGTAWGTGAVHTVQTPAPTLEPTPFPTIAATPVPTPFPTPVPTLVPTLVPTVVLTEAEPTILPTPVPTQQPPPAPVYHGHCGTMLNDTKYEFEGGSFLPVDHIATPEMCCAMCDWWPECQAWTWVLDQGLVNGEAAGQCRMRSDLPSGRQTGMLGHVSGLPPKRPLLTSVADVDVGPSSSASLFCFSLILPTGYELELVQWQHKQQASIFQCDEYAIYSNTSLNVASGLTTKTVEGNLQCSHDHYQTMNAWIFVAVWRQVIGSNRWSVHDWTVKVDTDSVFFPGRLRHLLHEHSSAGYISNCEYGMHGPVEVLSRDAVAALAGDFAASWDGKAPRQCVASLRLGKYEFSEDLFLDQCLWKVLKVKPRHVERRLTCEPKCQCDDWMWCTNGAASFHPYKTIESYSQCMANAMAS